MIMNLNTRYTSLLPILVILLATTTTKVPVVHGLIQRLSCATTTLGGILHIFDGEEAPNDEYELDVNHIEVSLKYMYEIGSDRVSVLRGMDAFDRTFFSFTELMQGQTANIPAMMKTVSKQFIHGRALLRAYLMTGVGTFYNGGEDLAVDFFDVKLHMELNEYAFCTDCPVVTVRETGFLDPLLLEEGEEEEATAAESLGSLIDGEYVDLAFSVTGANYREYGRTNRVESEHLEFGIGGSITMVLSRRIKVDGVWMDMPDGFPALDQVDGESVFVVRFPKFASSVIYNPFLTTSREGMPTTMPSFMPSLMPTVSNLPTVSVAPTPTLGNNGGTRSNGVGPDGETPGANGENGQGANGENGENNGVGPDGNGVTRGEGIGDWKSRLERMGDPFGVGPYDGEYVNPSTCGDLSSNSAVVLTAWNTFQDANEIEGGGQEMIVDRHATLMRDAIEFPLFPKHYSLSSPPSDGSTPPRLYDIDFTRDSIAFTLRTIPDENTEGYNVTSHDGYDRYYFDFGAPITNATIVRELTSINSTVEILPQGFSTSLSDPLDLNIDIPELINGGLLVSVLPGANLSEVGQSIVVCYSRADVNGDDNTNVTEGTNSSACGDQGIDSNIEISTWNMFVDADDLEEGKGVIWDTFGSKMTEEVEFHREFYKINFTKSSITYTLRNNSAANDHLIFSDGSYDRYYFSFRGKRVTGATIVKPATTIESTVQILLPGYAMDEVEQKEMGVVFPPMTNGGLLVTIVPGANITDIGQHIVICYSLDDGQEEPSFELGRDSSRSSSSSSRLHSSLFLSIGTLLVAAIVGCVW